MLLKAPNRRAKLFYLYCNCKIFLLAYKAMLLMYLLLFDRGIFRQTIVPDALATFAVVRMSFFFDKKLFLTLLNVYLIVFTDLVCCFAVAGQKNVEGDTLRHIHSNLSQ